MPHALCQSIKIERHFAAPVEKVFEAWIKPELRARWFAPIGVIAVADGAVLRRGSRETIMEHRRTALCFHDITYLEVTAPRRISYRVDTYSGGRHIHTSAVAVTFKVVADGTHLSILQDVVDVAFPGTANTNRLASENPFIAPEERLVAAPGLRAPF